MKADTTTGTYLELGSQVMLICVGIIGSEIDGLHPYGSCSVKFGQEWANKQEFSLSLWFQEIIQKVILMNLQGEIAFFLCTVYTKIINFDIISSFEFEYQNSLIVSVFLIDSAFASYALGWCCPNQVYEHKKKCNSHNHTLSFG